MICDFPLDKPPGLYIGKYETCWTVSAYLQVGSKSFRHHDKDFTQLEDALEFIKRWAANWKELAAETWDYFGPEDIVELDLEGKRNPIQSVDVANALANLIKPQAPIVRRKI